MKKILVADDELLILYALSRALNCAQTEVKTVRTGKDALREIKDHCFDLCLLDIYLPDMVGLDIANILKKTAPATKIIVMTASEVDTDMMKTIREKSYIFLSKPFDLFQVKSFVNQILNEGGMSDQNATSFTNVNRRQHERTKIEKTIAYSAACPDSTERVKNIKADIINISSAGMGITTTCPLAPGCMLMFGGGIEHTMGVVRWNRIIEGNTGYRAGIEFI
jgi:DNA-binding NtrC family response regulator